MKKTLLVGLSVLSPLVAAWASAPGAKINPDVDSLVNSRTLGEVEVLGHRTRPERQPSATLRLVQPLITVPQNIQVVTSALLSERQITNLDEGLMNLASGITRIEHWGAYSRFNARGSRLAAFRDGMNITTTWGPMTEDMAFVDRVEFVKGPAGFMMSNGEPAGLYNVVTKKPTWGRHGELSLSYGSHEFFRGTLDLDGLINDKLAYRFNVYGQSAQSHRKHEFAKRYGLAPVLNYKLSQDTDLTLQYMYQYLSTSNTGGPYNFTPDGFGSLGREASMLEPGLTPTVYNDHYLLARLHHRLSNKWTLTAQTAWSLSLKQGESMWVYIDKSWTKAVTATGDLIRRVNTADAKTDMRFGQAYLNGKEYTGSISHSFLMGLDLGEKNSWHDWMQGHNLDTAEKPFNIYTAKNNGAPANGYPRFDRSKSLEERADATRIRQSYVGLYVQDQIGFFDDALRLTLAARYTDVKDNSYGTTVTHERHITPRLGLSYSVDKATSVYALYDQAFNPQMGRTRTSDKLKPITGNTYEIGLKREWFGGRLSTSIAAYTMLRNNETTADPQNTASEDYKVQDGQSRAQGVEFDLAGELLPGLRLIANYAFTDYKVTKSILASRPVGMRLPGYAKHTVNAWLTYALPKGFQVGLGYNAQLDRSSWGFVPATTTQSEFPDYHRFDANISYTAGQFSLGLNVNNLMDKHLYSGRAYADYTYQQSEAGRTFRLNMTYRF